MLFSTLGIGFVGVRKIAEVGDNKELRSQAFSALFIICFIFTVFISGILILATFTVEKFESYRPLLLVGLLKLWGNLFLINWLYQGIEDFKFITIRTICVKFLYLIAVFIFIHNASDYVTYYLLLSLMFVANAVVNCVVARRYVRFTLSLSEIRTQIRPMIYFGFYFLLNSMYITFNIFYLGWVSGSTQVGYYTTSSKLFQILLALYTAYSTVVMPRACSILAQGNMSEFKSLISKSINGLLMFSIPVGIFMMVFARPLITIFVGAGFEGAIVPMRIVMPLILIIGYEQILVIHILTPLRKDKQILSNSILGASVGILLNILLVSKFNAIGSAIVWVSAELSVMTLAQYFVTKDIDLKFPFYGIFINICAYLPYLILSIFFLKYTMCSDFINIVIGGLLLAIYFIVIQKYLLKNDLYNTIINKVAVKLPFLKFFKI